MPVHGICRQKGRQRGGCAVSLGTYATPEPAPSPATCPQCQPIIAAKDRQIAALRIEAEEAKAEVRRIKAALTSPNLTGEQARRVIAVTDAIEKAPEDPADPEWKNPDLFDVVKGAGISTVPADNSEEARKKAWRNAMANASRAFAFAEELGIVERADPVYLRQDRDDPAKITGAVPRVRLKVPAKEALYVAARCAEPRQAKKDRGIHVPLPTCPKCGSKHMWIKCEECHWEGTTQEWGELEAERRATEGPGLQTLQPDDEGPGLQKMQGNESISLQKMQPGEAESGLNHSPTGVSVR